MTEEQYLAYEVRLKHILDEESFKREMERKQEKIDRGKLEIEKDKQEIKRGKLEIEKEQKEIEKGKQEIENRKLEIEEKAKKTVAKRLLEIGTKIDVVVESTDLSKENVIKINDNLQN